MDRGHTVGYFSSYDRGLEALLDMWPEIKKQVPDATLTIAYGWNTYDSVHKHDPAKMKWKWQMIRKMHDVGAKEVGRLNHEDLAKLMKQTKVLAYPTEFTEIFMITMIKALAAGMIPVSSGVAAIQETQGGYGHVVPVEDMYSNTEAQDKFVQEVVKALNDNEYDSTEAKDWVLNTYSWEDIAKQWSQVFES